MFLRSGPPLDRFAKLGAAMGPQDTQLVLGIGLEEVPNRGGAFPRLDDEQRVSLRELGEVRRRTARRATSLSCARCESLAVTGGSPAFRQKQASGACRLLASRRVGGG